MMRYSLSDAVLETRLPQNCHYDVSLDEVAPHDEAKMPSKRDYLRIYYSDFLRQKPAKGPAFADDEQTTIESDTLTAWVLAQAPRSRIDTYPLYLLTKDLLQKLSSGQCKIINSERDRLREELRQCTQNAKDAARAAEKKNAALAQRVEALSLELTREASTHGEKTGDLVQSVETMESRLAATKQELQDTQTALEKMAQVADKAQKEAHKAKKDAQAAVKDAKALREKCTAQEALLGRLQKGSGAPEFEAWSPELKIEYLGRLLCDEAIVKKHAFADAVTHTLLQAPPQGCSYPTKRQLACALLTNIHDHERAKGDDSSAVSFLAGILSRPVNDLITECVSKEIAVAPADEQAALVTSLGEAWFAGFESWREATDRVTHEFIAAACVSDLEGGQPTPAQHEHDVKLTREEVAKGLKELELSLGTAPVGVDRFVRCAVGDRWLCSQAPSSSVCIWYHSLCRVRWCVAGGLR